MKNFDEFMNKLRYNKKMSDICLKYGLNITLLKKLIWYRNEGLKMKEIAQKIGIGMYTIERYVKAFNSMTKDERMDLWNWSIERCKEKKVI